MEQEAVFDVGDFDERDVSLTETPRDPSHYLQQVSVSRARCPEVVTAKTIPQKIASSAISEDLLFSCEPPSKWSIAMSNKFSMQRSLVDAQKWRWRKTITFKWPSLKDPEEWRVFCLEERINSFPIKVNDIPRFAHHRGNPPTLQLVFSLSEQQVFLEEGYTRPLFEWIYALMLVLQKPLTHNVCSAIRQLAKHSRVLRNTLDEKTQSGSTMHEEFSLFIAVVGVYFEQLDIADQISS
ncbi:survival of motor neuron protein-interacting protein 1, putative [Brugia malayi]|uniref:Gem-associated protein 2 n=1 Tax=Brugia malayi TaxID=6279 RepID=A0A4E9F7P0_BRUMA|nr:survival of motor neuron protein-interacting protein 1, putative [Brugia malayi]VIO92012.1 survival of motor neuron protein-interacting protein 1, putative [Brugia malayi]